MRERAARLNLEPARWSLLRAAASSGRLCEQAPKGEAHSPEV